MIKFIIYLLVGYLLYRLVASVINWFTQPAAGTNNNQTVNSRDFGNHKSEIDKRDVIDADFIEINEEPENKNSKSE